MVRRTKAKAKAKTRAPGRKLGEAATLSHSLLQDWLAFLLDVGPTWLHVLIKLASCLCLRVTEACRLHKDDIDFKKRVIRVAPLKRQPEVLKPLLPECAQLFATLKKKGLSRKRAQRKGSRGQVTWQDRWPDDGSDGWLFPASRSDSKTPYRQKDTVIKAINRVREQFQPANTPLCLPNSKLRSHSCRNSCINMMKINQIPDEVGMQYARIKSETVYRSHGRMDMAQAAHVIRGNKKFRNSIARTVGLK